MRALIRDPPTPETLLSINDLKAEDRKKYLTYSGYSASDLKTSHSEDAIRHKFTIEEHDMPYSPEMDDEIEFYLAPKDFEASKGHNRFAKLRIIDETHSSRMDLANLIEHGMKIAPRGAINLSHKLYADLYSYITENF